MSTSVPTTPQEFLASALNQMPWYYSVEVFPGLVARGSFPDDLVMLPRLLARHADVAGHTCLDIGSMEGLLPVLLARRGAARVVATDAIAHCAPQMEAIKQYYGVEWYLSVPLLDYMLRMLRLAPIDCLHFEHAGLGLTPVVPGLRTGYMSVLCRASDERLPTGGDEYLEALQVHSWEFNSLTDWAAADSHPRSTIRATGPYDGVVRRDDLDAIDLWASVQHQPGHGPAVARDAHQLHLDDWD
jgi:hypothetical protein